MMSEITRQYAERKTTIRKRLAEFKVVGKKSDKHIFAELCFCICTSQSKARACDAAIHELMSEGMLLSNSKAKIATVLKKYGVRFHNNKASYIVEARLMFSENRKLRIKKTLTGFKSVKDLRAWLAEQVKGLGYKEASHFVRNIGLGTDIAILDRHVLKNLKRLHVIGEIPASISEKDYIRIENCLRRYCKQVEIRMDELDLLLWSEETGEVFK